MLQKWPITKSTSSTSMHVIKLLANYGLQDNVLISVHTDF